MTEMTRIVGYIPLPLDYQKLVDSLGLQQRSVVVFGKTYPQPRLTQWFGSVGYEYSNLKWPINPMPLVLGNMLAAVKDLTGHWFNSCLVNYYRDGSDAVGWHSDNEPIFGRNAVVASVSFGATRTFKMRRIKDHTDRLNFSLNNGSVLLMPAGTQEEWQHCIPKETKVTDSRLNFTFRNTVGT